MNEQRDKHFVQYAVNTGLSSIQGNSALAQSIIRQEGTRTASVKKKVSLALVLSIVFIIAAMTALAAGIAFHIMTQRVAALDAGGQMMTWGLHEKYAFVQAMRESGYAMNGQDWQVLSDESRTESDREAAADRIIYERYGAVQEEANASRPLPAASVLGNAPDAVLIFRERFLAENPDATDDDYTDALGYWLRDAYIPQLEAAKSADASSAEAEPSQAVLTREMAETSAREQMTEVFGWPEKAANQASLVSEQDAQSGAWHITAQISADALEDAFEPVLEDAMLQKTAFGYSFSYWVILSANGSYCRSGDLNSLLATVEEVNRREALYQIDVDEAESIALAAIREKYSLGHAEIKKYFVYTADTYTNDASCIRLGVLLRTRNNSAAPWDYAAIVNLTTGSADDVFSVDALFGEKMERLAAAWEKLRDNGNWLNYLRWYSTWCPYGDFGAWPVSMQKKASELFRKAGAQQRGELTDETGYYPLRMFTNHLYGEPADDELSEESAHRIACEKASQTLDISAQTMASWSVKRTYSRDKDSRPIWRFLLYDPNSTAGQAWHFVVWMDGMTGEILYADQTAPNGSGWYNDADVL